MFGDIPNKELYIFSDFPASILKNEKITKIFHYGRADLAFIKYYLKTETNNILDTKIASKLSRSYSDNHSLKTLIKEFVNIDIYDLMGRRVKSLINNNLDAGYRSVYWDATNDLGQPVSAGMYIYTIQAGEYRQTKKMVLLK